MSLRKAVNIVVTADSICPFCYLGFSKVRKAIDVTQAKGLPLDITLRFAPYQLDPTLPTDKPINKRERYKEKFGADRINDMETMMKQRFASEGLDISYDGVLRQTTLSHRLIAKAWDAGKRNATGKSDQEVTKAAEAMQLTTIERIYHAYFKVGVFEDVETAKSWLEGTEGLDEYKAGVLAAQRMGIRGVPFFRINEKWGISGAQDSELFVKVFQQIANGELV
ncbi:hypothetical protein CPB86DRAFT_593143 [Serendipita vermifera]|nr:hypothetical protein CPB86DRAFT_593143 [Serendipita vermifera]